MSIPDSLGYTTSHEWVRKENDSITVGITDHAQEMLGDLVFIELPEAGKSYAAQEKIAVVESVKAASDIYAPVAGKVSEVNQALESAPEQVNENAYGAWLFRMEPDHAADVDTLMDADAYLQLISD